LLTLGTSLFAQSPPPEDPLEEQPKEWYEKIDFYADLRFRYDASWRPDFEDVFRYRLRAGFEADVSDFLDAGFEFRSGNPRNPVSDNQDFGGGLGKKDFKLAEAYGDFRLSDSFFVVAGKFEARRYWVVSDMQWDSDVTTEGFMQRLAPQNKENGVLNLLRASVYQIILEQGDEQAAWLLGAQLRPEFEIGEHDTFTVGIGYDYYVDPQLVVNLSLEGELGGNKVTNLLDDSGQLVSDFRILTAFVQWRNESNATWPLFLRFFYYKNTGAKDRLGTEIGTGAQGTGTDNDTGFFFRAAIGGGRNVGDLAIRFTYYYSQPDSILYAYTQSDTRRASNLNGTRVDFRVAMPAGQSLNFTWYRTEPELGEAATMNRLFVDYVLGF
jgi:hypothetical protein